MPLISDLISWDPISWKGLSALLLVHASKARFKCSKVQAVKTLLLSLWTGHIYFCCFSLLLLFSSRISNFVLSSLVCISSISLLEFSVMHIFSSNAELLKFLLTFTYYAFIFEIRSNVFIDSFFFMQCVWSITDYLVSARCNTSLISFTVMKLCSNVMKCVLIYYSTF